MLRLSGFELSAALVLDLDRLKIEIRGVSKPTQANAVRACFAGHLLNGQRRRVRIHCWPSGCGKSLLYVVGGLAADGEVIIDGSPIKGLARTRRRLSGVCIISVADCSRQLRYGLDRQRVAASERDKIVSRLVSVIGLSGFENRYPRELSGGMNSVWRSPPLACEPPPAVGRALWCSRRSNTRNHAGRTAEDLAGDPKDGPACYSRCH